VFRRHEFTLRFGDPFHEIVLEADDVLDHFVTVLDRCQYFVLRDFLRFGLHHYNGLFRSGHHEIQFALFNLLERRINDRLPINMTDPDSGYRAIPRNVGQHQRH
jgi:hypothetical protein